GNGFEVLVAEKKGNTCFGKAQNDAAIAFESETANIGDFIDVRVMSAKNANLVGEVAE
ncbi:MAG: TRAM domain-containing protein, partial [Clostridiales bacterium]|nr:TRAM domain-containing protein [Clostridiales bacterium]